jgi:L-fucose mutarotase/ribose pyranase (RbsD/FucU family)
VTQPPLDTFVDATLDAYVEWREECEAVEVAYRHWSAASAEDGALAFAVYVAALDREQRASNAYARLVVRNRGRYADLRAEKPGRGRTGPNG